jgi:hypothetical protein
LVVESLTRLARSCGGGRVADGEFTRRLYSISAESLVQHGGWVDPTGAGAKRPPLQCARTQQPACCPVLPANLQQTQTPVEGVHYARSTCAYNFARACCAMVVASPSAFGASLESADHVHGAGCCEAHQTTSDGGEKTFTCEEKFSKLLDLNRCVARTGNVGAAGLCALIAGGRGRGQLIWMMQNSFFLLAKPCSHHPPCHHPAEKCLHSSAHPLLDAPPPHGHTHGALCVVGGS